MNNKKPHPIVWAFALCMLLALLAFACTNTTPKPWPQVQPNELYTFPEWPTHGTFWEVGIEQGFFPDSDETHPH